MYPELCCALQWAWRSDCGFRCQSQTELYMKVAECGAMLNTAIEREIAVKTSSWQWSQTQLPMLVNVQGWTRIACSSCGTEESLEWVSGVGVARGSDKAGYQTSTSEGETSVDPLLNARQILHESKLVLKRTMGAVAAVTFGQLVDSFWRTCIWLCQRLNGKGCKQAKLTED